MPKLTMKEHACLFAWQLGHGDYPALDQCPYNPGRSAHLHAKYWSGWKAAAENAGATGKPRKRLAGAFEDSAVV